PATAAVPAGGVAASTWTLPAPPAPWPLLLLALLLAGAAVRLAGVVAGLGALRRLKHRALPVPAAREGVLQNVIGTAPVRGVEVRVSAEVRSPVTVGFFRPMILLPAALQAEMTEDELRQVTLHELAHLRRRDDWGNLLQRLLEALLFFNPAVGWIGRRLELEREIACDDQVVAALPGHRAYAQCLARLAALRAGRRTPLAPGAAPLTGQLARRIGALLAADRPADLRLSGAAVAAAAVVLLASGASIHRAAPSLALTREAAPAPPVLAAARAHPAPPRPLRFPPQAPGTAAPASDGGAPGAARALAGGAAVPAAHPAPVAAVVAACAECGPPVREARIVERVRVPVRAPGALRAARAPAPPLQRGSRGGVEVSVVRAARIRQGAGPAVRRPGGFRLRVWGGGGGWEPYAAPRPRW